MKHIIARRLTDDCPEGFTTPDGATYYKARVKGDMLQISSDGGASWDDVDWRRVEFTCARTGRRVRFWREHAELALLRTAEYYVVLAVVALIGSLAGVWLTW